MNWPVRTNSLRDLVFKIFTLNKGYLVRLGQKKFRLDESLRRYSVSEDDALYQCLKDNLNDGDVFFDVGANIGLYSLLACDLISPNGRVYAFEPAPANVQLLQRNVALNGYNTEIEVKQIALTDQFTSKSISFYTPKNGGVSPESSLITGGKNEKEVKVQTDTIDHFCANNRIRPTVIKIDTEGAELPILKGALDIVSNCYPMLIVEYHGSKTVDFGYDIQELWRTIERLGYEQIYIMKKNDGYFMTLCRPINRR